MKKIEIGLDLTKETKKVDNFIVHGDPNPDWDRIKEVVKKKYYDSKRLNYDKNPYIIYMDFLFLQFFIRKKYDQDI